MNINIKILLTILSIFSTTLVMAQGAPPATPIDGGLGLLLAGGVAYGIKRIAKSRSDN